MGRLVDADALKELIANNVYLVQDAFNDRDYGMFWTGGIEKAIDDAPAIDAVEVVRCKDCKFFRRYGFRLEYAECIKFDFYDTTEDGYCSWGERRNDG